MVTTLVLFSHLKGYRSPIDCFKFCNENSKTITDLTPFASSNMLSNIEDVLWSITDICNLKCIYCSVSDNKINNYQKSTAQEPTIEELDHIIKELQTIPSLKSLILSGGEALLSPNLPYILHNASQFCSNIFIITNGVKFTSEAFDLVKTYRPTIMISIDSIKENINCKTRGVGVLEKSLSTINSLNNINMPLVVILVVTKYNIDTIIHDLNYYYEKGVKNILLQQLHCEGRANGTLFLKLSPTASQIDMLYHKIKEFRKFHEDMNIDDNEICFFPMRKEQYEKKCDSKINYLPQRLFSCGAGFKFFAIKTNGDVIPCNALRSCVLGNLHQNSLVDIFKSSYELNNLKNINAKRVDSIDGCSMCRYAPVCDGGCRADVLHLTGNIFGKHPYCNVLNPKFDNPAN